MSGRCANCTLRCDGYLCRHCKDHVRCVDCRRYLPIYCYSDASKECHACVRKLSKRSSARNIVNEVNIPTARGTESFDSFVASNSELINAFVEDYRRSMAPYAYTSVLMPSLRARSKAAYKEYQLFSVVPFKILTRLNKWTCNVSPPIYLHRLTIGTLEAAASFSSAL